MASNKQLGMPEQLAALTPEVSAVSAPKCKQPMNMPGNPVANTVKPFIFWDGEAVKDGGYCLLGCSTGDEVCKFPELRTVECLQLILKVGRENKKTFHVAFAFDYDVNNILIDVSKRTLQILRETGRIVWRGYKIQHIPKKWFMVSKDGVSVRIDDCFSYFRQRFDKALMKYGIGTDAEREEVSGGKDDRDKFVWADIDRIRHYWQLELKLGVELIGYIRRVVNKAGFNVGMWHGSAALASFALSQHKMTTHKREYRPDEVELNNAIRIAYAGGWFERFKIGVHRGPIYTADINSAYVYAMSLLPSMATGEWYHIRNPRWDEYSRMRMGIYHIHYNFGTQRDLLHSHLAACFGCPAPLFLRSQNNSMSHPIQVDGWYYAPEAALIMHDVGKHAEISEAWIFDDDGSYPFEWVGEMYLERLALQAENDPAEKALKWALASMYGKLAQRAGWDKKKRKAPTWHQLEWAGWITSKCRAMIYPAALEAAEGNGLVSIDTDGVMSTVPFKKGLLTGEGNQLGRWKVEQFSELVYMQTGFYWLRGMDGEWKPPKTRGIPSTKIGTPELALEAFRGDGRIQLKRNLFIGYGAALQGRWDEWRQWVETDHVVDALNAGNRLHVRPMCRACGRGVKMTDGLHDLAPVFPEGTTSHPHKLPWLENVKGGEKLDLEGEEIYKHRHILTEEGT